MLDDAQGGERSRGPERVACEGGSVRSGSEQVGQLLSEGDHAAHREASCHTFGEGDDIRGHTTGEFLLLEGEPAAGTSDAGLHFVDDEQRMMLVAQLPRLAYILGADRHDAGFALDEFHDDRGDRAFAVSCGSGRVECSLERFDVAGFDEFDRRDERLERLADHGLPSGAQRAQSATVETVDHGDDTRRLAALFRQCTRKCTPVQLGKLDGRLIAFGARIAEIDVGPFRGSGELDQFRCEFDLRFGGEIVAGVGDFGRLLADGLHPRRMGVTERVNRDACKEIKVFIAIDIPDARALAVIHDA